jgi:poly-gamma-glutamate capsule biosynthesis protein CapA/YwtB (metallophosphatase superfamily)
MRTEHSLSGNDRSRQGLNGQIKNRNDVEVILKFAGDISVGGLLPEEFIATPSLAFPGSVVQALKADICFANLESPFSATGSDNGKEWGVLWAKDEAISIIKHAGFHIVSLANNHICDAGHQGLFLTMDLLKKHGIKYVGAGRNLAKARRPELIMVASGETVAFLAYLGQGHFPVHATQYMTATDDSPGAAPLVPEVYLEDIHKAAAEYDIVVVSVHWSRQDIDWVAPFRKGICDEMTKAGASVVVGHHPHRLQAVRSHKGKMIYYSLGNFFFPPFHDARPHHPTPKTKQWNQLERSSVIARICLKSGAIYSEELIPTVQESDQAVLRLANMTERTAIKKHIARLSRITNSFYYLLFYFFATFLCDKIKILAREPGWKSKMRRIGGFSKRQLLRLLGEENHD